MRILAAVAVGEVQVDDNGRGLTAAVEGGVPQLRTVLQRLEDDKIEVLDVGLRRPTLDDVFLSLTGRAAEDLESDDNDKVEVTA